MKNSTSFTRLTVILFIVSGISIRPAILSAETNTVTEVTPTSNMVEDTDGDIGPNEYTKISPNGGITRRPCPYTCEMRGIPREHCKEWAGVDKSAKMPECYVHDLRLPSDAIKFGAAH